MRLHMADSDSQVRFDRGAAFFDLDRTLVVGASGEVFSEAMKAAGLVGRSIPGESLLFRIFNTIGETVPSMALARQAAVLAKGKSQAAVQRAAVDAATSLLSMVQPFAQTVFAEHRAHGRPIVLATTTPYDLVKPLADLLGLDDVIATRYGLTGDGTYDGTIVGPFVWSAGKLAAVEAWAHEHGVSLADSFAYSDSVFDTPLLAAVGHPFVVNPDPRMVLMAAARRWPSIDLSKSPDDGEAASAGETAGAGGHGSSVAKIPVINLELQQVALSFAHPIMFPYARFDVAGVENIPESGPAIIVGNHRSYFDIAAMAVAIARTGRTVRFLGKKEVFDAPIIGQLATAMGGIRVDRASGSDEPLQAAAEALAAGDVVALMPQGTIPRGHAFFDPVLKGRWGAARLAAMTKAPVIPIGLWGTEKVWPRSARLPAVLNVVDPPLVRIRVGGPVALKYASPETDTKRIMKALMTLLPAESSKPHDPTPEELALTLPPGYRGSDTREQRRRPGTD